MSALEKRLCSALGMINASIPVVTMKVPKRIKNITYFFILYVYYNGKKIKSNLS